MSDNSEDTVSLLADDIQAYLTMDGIYLDVQQCMGLARVLLLDEDWSIRATGESSSERS